MLRIALASLVLLLAQGCELINGSSGPKSNTDRPDFSSIDDPRERWEAYGFTDYDVRQTRICFCAGPREYVAVVRGNDVVELRDPVPDTEDLYPEHYMTIDEVFNMLEETARQNPVVFEVEFDPQYGYPTSIEIDVSRQMADEELTMTMSDFRPF